MTIDVRVKGIPMKPGTRVDEEGYHVFSLDESKHDPFEVIERLFAAMVKATGIEPARDLARDARYAAVMREMKLTR